MGKKSQYHYSKLVPLNTRSILPLLPSNQGYPSWKELGHLPDPPNVQGDVYLLLPKSHENFIFFSIYDPDQFKRDLALYSPTTSEDVIENLRLIAEAKANAPTRADIRRVDLAQTQIAFSRSGLNLLGLTDKVQDVHFDGGSMRREKQRLGDKGTWDDLFANKTIHGVIIVAASHENECIRGTNRMKTFFRTSAVYEQDINGNTRPGNQKGHEHFGFMDAISQPAFRGLVKPNQGQRQADAGVGIMGYKGDPVFNDASLPDKDRRPLWTKDGTLMVFRKLEQDVLGWNAYLKQNGPNWRQWLAPAEVQGAIRAYGRPLTDTEGEALFGARLVGRWASGTPLAKARFRDVPSMAEDNQKNNDFDYKVTNVNGPSSLSCPFIAHTRKTVPRNLEPYISTKTLEAALTVRAGLPYGKELTNTEKQAGSTNTKRGLLFVCYQSSLANGFWKQTQNSGDDYFPPTSPNAKAVVQGQDPIIGGPSKTVAPLSFQQDYFVTSRGGEYFFVPSVSLLNAIAGKVPIPRGVSSPHTKLKAFHGAPPAREGLYRIRPYSHGDLFWELIADYDVKPGPWVKLCKLNMSSERQKWHIRPLGNSRFYITSAYDGNGLADSGYGYCGYHYPYPKKVNPEWIIQSYHNRRYSKIRLRSKSAYPLDSYNNEVVHFYKENNNALNQRWLFVPV